MQDKSQSKYQLSFFSILLTFIFFMLAAPILKGFWSILAVSIFFVLILLSSVIILSEQKITLLLGIVLGITSSSLIIYDLITSSLWTHVSGRLTASLLLVMTIAFQYRQVFIVQKNNRDTIFGAICIYVLLAFWFSLIYGLIALFEPNAFQGFDMIGKSTEDLLNESRLATRNFLYFSIVTQTTLGYGDIYPQSHFAQNLTAIQAIMGQFYIAILVAGLVGRVLSRPRKSTAAERKIRARSERRT